IRTRRRIPTMTSAVTSSLLSGVRGTGPQQALRRLRQRTEPERHQERHGIALEPSTPCIRSFWELTPPDSLDEDKLFSNARVSSWVLLCAHFASVHHRASWPASGRRYTV